MTKLRRTTLGPTKVPLTFIQITQRQEIRYKIKTNFSPIKYAVAFYSTI